MNNKIKYQIQTQEAILKRITERRETDSFGFEWHEYVDALTFENAKQFLVADAKGEGWTAYTANDVYEQMKDYMQFAFDKAQGERGVSANRSIMHYIAWTWLIDQEFSAEIERMYRDGYSGYGLSILKHIREHYGWEDPV